MPCSFQNVTTSSVPVDLKCSRRKIETQRQLRTREKLLNHEIAFGGCVPGVVSASSSRVRTARTAYSTVVFKRPPKGAGLAQHVAKDLRMTQGDECCCQPASAIASDNGLL